VINDGFTQSATRKFKIAAWTGNAQGMGKVIETCRGLQADALLAAQNRLSESESERKTMYINEYASWTGLPAEATDQLWQERDQREREELSRRLALRMTAVERKWSQEYNGSPEEIMQQIDPTDVVKLAIEIGQPWSLSARDGYALSITMSRDTGVEVQVTAPSSGWVAQAEGQLRTLLMAGRPWYHFMQNIWWSVLIVWIPLMATIWSYQASRTNAPSSPLATPETVIILITIGVVIPILTNLLSAGIRKLLPAFELTGPGGQASGARKLAIAGSVGAWIVASVVIPLWLSLSGGA